MRSQGGGDEAGFGDVAGAELEDERPHLGQGIPLELAQEASLAGTCAGSRWRSISIRRDSGVIGERLGDRVVQLASEVGTLLAGSQLGGLARRSRSSPLALAHVARRPVSAREEAAVSDHADAGHLERQLPAILGHHR